MTKERDPIRICESSKELGRERPADVRRATTIACLRHNANVRCSRFACQPLRFSSTVRRRPSTEQRDIAWDPSEPCIIARRPREKAVTIPGACAADPILEATGHLNLPPDAATKPSRGGAPSMTSLDGAPLDGAERPCENCLILRTILPRRDNQNTSSFLKDKYA